MVRNNSSGIATPTANSDMPVAARRLEIAGQPGEIAERDEAEDEEDGFGERRHFSGIGEPGRSAIAPNLIDRVLIAQIEHGG